MKSGHVSEKAVPCRECQERIRFISTPKGKQLPINAEAVDATVPKVGDKVVNMKGEVVVVRETFARSGGKVWIPHWATCTAPNKFRKSERTKDETTRTARA